MYIIIVTDLEGTFDCVWQERTYTKEEAEKEVAKEKKKDKKKATITNTE